MPDWADKLINYGALGVICAFFMWGIVSVARFIAPKVTQVVEAFLSFMVTMTSNGSTTNECLTRMCAMLDHTVKGVDQLHHKTDTLQRSFDGLTNDFHEVRDKVDEHDELLRGRKESTA